MGCIVWEVIGIVMDVELGRLEMGYMIVEGVRFFKEEFLVIFLMVFMNRFLNRMSLGL